MLIVTINICQLAIENLHSASVLCTYAQILFSVFWIIQHQIYMYEIYFLFDWNKKTHIDQLVIRDGFGWIGELCIYSCAYMVSGACSQRPLFFALAMSAISLSGRKSLDAAQVRRVEELSDHPEPPPLPHFCQARVFRGAEQCSRTPLPGSSFCFQHQDCLFAFECVMCTECVTDENRFCFICIWNHFFKQWRHRVPCPDHDTSFFGKDQTIFYSRHWVHTMLGYVHTASPSRICCLKLHSFTEFSKDSCHTICLMLDFVELRMFPGGCAMASSEYHWAPKSVDGGLTSSSH